MFIYLFQYNEASSNEQVYQQMVIFSVYFVQENIPVNKQININIPWSQWLYENYFKLPYPVADIDKQIGTVEQTKATA